MFEKYETVVDVQVESCLKREAKSEDMQNKNISTKYLFQCNHK